MPVTQVPPGGLGDAISPEQWARFILERLGHASVVLRSGARDIRTSASVLHVPRFTKDAAADWYGELEEINEGAPEGDELELRPRKVATGTVLSNEVVADANPGSVNAIGEELLKAVGLAADRAIFRGTGGKQPTGILGQIDQEEIGDVADYDVVVKAGGQITEHGGEPDSLYVAAADWTALLLLKDEVGRPLIQPDVAERAAPRFAGLGVYSTPALTAGTAIVAEAQQIVVATRRDASVEMSTDAFFMRDGTAARVVARMDCGLNDPRGLCAIKSSAARSGEAKSAARK